MNMSVIAHMQHEHARSLKAHHTDVAAVFTRTNITGCLTKHEKVYDECCVNIVALTDPCPQVREVIVKVKVLQIPIAFCPCK